MPIAFDDDRAARFAGRRWRSACDVHAGAEAAQDVEQRRARRVQADVLDVRRANRGAPRRRPARRRPRRSRRAPAASGRAGAGRRRPTRSGRRPSTVTPKAASARSVWSRVCGRFGDAGRALGVQAGQEDRALDLRARRLGRVVQWRAVACRARSAAHGRRPRRCGRPSCSSGSMTRRIGRRDSEASPIIVAVKGGPRGCRPACASSCRSCRRRAAPAGERSCPKPRPSRVTVPSASCHIDTQAAQAGERRLAVGAWSIIA